MLGNRNKETEEEEEEQEENRDDSTDSNMLMAMTVCAEEEEDEEDEEDEKDEEDEEEELPAPLNEDSSGVVCAQQAMGSCLPTQLIKGGADVTDAAEGQAQEERRVGGIVMTTKTCRRGDDELSAAPPAEKVAAAADDNGEDENGAISVPRHGSHEDSNAISSPARLSDGADATTQSTPRRMTTGFRPARALTALGRARSAPGAYAVRGSTSSLATRWRRNTTASTAEAAAAGGSRVFVGSARVVSATARGDQPPSPGHGATTLSAGQPPILGFTVDRQMDAHRSSSTRRSHRQLPHSSGSENVLVVDGVAIHDATSDEGLASAASPTLSFSVMKPIKTLKDLIHQRKRLFCTSLILLVAAVIVGVIAGVLVSRSNHDDDGDDNHVKSKSPSSPSARFEQIRSLLLKSYYYDHEELFASVLDDASSPQHSALVWIADEDERRVDTTDSESIVQRFALATFYFATKGKQQWANQCNFLSTDHECYWNETVPEYGQNSSRGEDAWARYVQSSTDNSTNGEIYGGVNFPFKGVFCFGDSPMKVTHITIQTLVSS